MAHSERNLGRALGPVALAIAGGGAWGLCFGAEARPWLAPLALIALLHLSRRRQLLACFLYGLASWLTAVPWIARTVRLFGDVPRPLDLLALFALASYLSLFTALFAALARRPLNAPSPIAPLIAVPALWCLCEWARGVLLGGFPWNLAAYAWTDVPGALAWSSWLGSIGVSFLLLTFATALYLVVIRGPRLAPGLAALAVLFALSQAERWALGEASEATFPVRIVQPASEILSDPNDPELRTSYNRLMALSRDACDVAGALLVWPESAAWPWAFERDPTLRQQVEALAEAGCPVLLNSPRWQDERVFNSAFLVRGRDDLSRTDKRHLVPFGEYVPLPAWVPFFDSLARNVGDFSAADTSNLLALGEHRLGVSICFEITFPGEVVDHVRAGADVLATLTNDGWYGDSSAPYQHLRAARFRAAENGRPVVRAALTGISAIIEADGSVSASLGVGERGVLRGSVGPRTTRTLFSKAPWLMLALCVLGASSVTIRAARFGASAPSKNP